MYLRARYYDPGTGQFLSRDPLTAMTGSPYGYVEGNPLNGTDPLGLFRIPGTSWCIDIGDPSCRSIKEQHQAGAQQVANFAGGIVKGIGLGNGDVVINALGQGGKVDLNSTESQYGQLAGFALDVPFATTAPSAQLLTYASRASSVASIARSCVSQWDAHCAAQIVIGGVNFSSSYFPILDKFGPAANAFVGLLTNSASMLASWINYLDGKYLRCR